MRTVTPSILWSSMPVAKKFAAESERFAAAVAKPRPAILRADRHPYAVRNGVGEFMIGERRDQTDDAFRHALCGFGEGVMRVHGRRRGADRGRG